MSKGSQERRAMKKVTEEEFDAFVAAYPRPLERNVVAMGEPAQLQFNDFALGDWPDSVVAGYSLYGGDRGDIWAKVPCDWRIKEDV